MNKQNNLAEYLRKKRENSNYEWKCTICGEIFKTRREMQKHRKNVHNFKNGQAWNKGLTTETDERIAKYVQTLKQHIKDGTVKLKGHKTSNETKEKLSIWRSKQLKEMGFGGFKFIKWYKIKNIVGAEFTVRGTWELLVAQRLNEQNVLWIRNKWIDYENDIKRHYNPDFYLPQTNEYIEVKGYYSEKDKNKMKCVISQHEGIRIYFIDSKIIEKIVKDQTIKILDENYLLTRSSFE